MDLRDEQAVPGEEGPVVQEARVISSSSTMEASSSPLMIRQNLHSGMATSHGDRVVRHCNMPLNEPEMENAPPRTSILIVGWAGIRRYRVFHEAAGLVWMVEGGSVSLSSSPEVLAKGLKKKGGIAIRQKARRILPAFDMGWVNERSGR